MIRSIWVETLSGDRLDIDLRRSADELGLLVFNLEGLGPPKATVSGRGGPNFDGIKMNSVRADSRQIVFTIAITAKGDREEAAKALVYKFFPSKGLIKFGVVTDRYESYVDAVVEENEFNQFSTVENAVISLLCPQPYFRDVEINEHYTNFSATEGLLYFPVTNNAVSSPEIELGIYVPLPTIEVVNHGGATVGCNIIMYFGYGNTNGIHIRNSNGDQLMRIDPRSGTGTFSLSSIHINTVVGEKSVQWYYDGEYTNILNDVRLGDDWITIEPGVNTITFDADEEIDNLLGAEISFYRLRQGV